VSEQAYDAPSGELLTVDELAAATGMTVRTTRYYAGLGLLPAPERRGRMAYYGPEHRARLELIRALQDHGFTLAAIEKYLKRLPADASVEDLAVQRAGASGSPGASSTHGPGAGSPTGSSRCSRPCRASPGSRTGSRCCRSSTSR
jgi:DNA-binding transcriptional MerR regulator